MKNDCDNVIRVVSAMMHAIITNECTNTMINKEDATIIKTVINTVAPSTLYCNLYDSDMMTELDNYMDNYMTRVIETETFDEELPTEFCDPILCTPLVEPVMLPNVTDLYFDKSCIVNQLYHEQKNPYTREPLTLDTLQEYNETPEVCEKIALHMERYMTWKRAHAITKSTN